MLRALPRRVFPTTCCKGRLKSQSEGRGRPQPQKGFSWKANPKGAVGPRGDCEGLGEASKDTFRFMERNFCAIPLIKSTAGNPLLADGLWEVES